MNKQLVEKNSTMLKEVLEGLNQLPKALPSKYFYDERGSELFEQITRLEEYYPTRTEKSIMKNNMGDIINHIGGDSVLVELGSGSSKKTRLLLDHLPDLAAYVPVEISEQYLARVVTELKKEYPDLLIKQVCADYTQPFEVPAIETKHTYYVLFYPGSTIGNFHPGEAQDFLSTVSQILNPGGSMLIGVDLKKDKKVLEAAYNDSKGITADFNKNILRRLNRELDANFDIDHFTHKAFYNEQEGRIEMHLVSNTQQEVTIYGEQFHFEEGESIHTENSYKYSLEEFKELVSDWFSVEKVWTDENNYFSLQFLKKRDI
jgi:dimethylhistidine N-methyltransferase